MFCSSQIPDICKYVELLNRIYHHKFRETFINSLFTALHWKFCPVLMSFSFWKYIEKLMQFIVEI